MLEPTDLEFSVFPVLLRMRLIGFIENPAYCVSTPTNLRSGKFICYIMSRVNLAMEKFKKALIHEDDDVYFVNIQDDSGMRELSKV